MSCLVFVCPSCIQPHHWHQILNCSNEAWTSKVEQIILSLICHSRVSIIKMQGQFSCYLLWDTNNFILLKTIFYILLVYYVLFVYTLCPQKNFTVCFLAISQLLLGQIQKVRSVLKTTGSKNFKTVLTFEIWPSRSFWIFKTQLDTLQYFLWHFPNKWTRF